MLTCNSGRHATGPTDEAVRDGDRLLRAMLRRTAPLAGALAVLVSVAVAGHVVFPYAIGNAVDVLLAGHRVGKALGLVVLSMAAMTTADVLGGLTATWATTTATRWLRQSALNRLLAAGVASVLRAREGETASMIVAGSQQAAALGPALLEGLAQMLISLGGVLALGLIDPWLVMVFLLGVPAAALISRAFVRVNTTLVTGYLDAHTELAGRLVDALRGLRSIRASGKVEQEIGRVLTPLPRLHSLGLRGWSVQGRIARQAGLLFPLIELAVLAVAGFQVSAGRLAPGQLLSAAGYVAMGLGLRNLTTLLSQLTRSRAGARQIASILTAPLPPAGHQALPDGCGRLQIEDVTVACDGQTLLSHVSADIPAGSMVVVAGRSGVGKSLLAAVAGGLIRPAGGRVLLDGADLRDIREDELHTAVAYAFEEPTLIGATVSDALRFGRGHATHDEVVSGARKAIIDDFIVRLPQAYQTSLSDAPMSGGEAQRLGLARALSRPSRLLILDDVTSSVDPVTEAAILAALGNLAGSPTQLIVTHQASIAARADQVLWLESGRLAGAGTHEQLQADPGYRAVFGIPEVAARPSAPAHTKPAYLAANSQPLRTT